MTTVNTKHLTNAARDIALAVPHRNAHPALAGKVAVEATEGHLVLRAFDYENGASVRVPAVGATFEATLVEHKALVTALRGMSKKVADVTEVTLTDDGTLVLSQAPIEAVLIAEEPDDYPPMPMQAEVGAFEIDVDALAPVVTQVAVTVGKDDLLPVLTGQHFILGSGTLKVESTDRFRLTDAEVEVATAEAADLLVPSAPLVKAVKALTGRAYVAWSDDYLVISDEHASFWLRLLDGEFPKLASLWPEGASTVFEVDADDAIRVLSSFRAESVVFEADGTQVRISDAHGSSGGRVVNHAANGSYRVGFTPSLFAQVAKYAKGQRITVAAENPKRPHVLTVGNGARFLLMPRRLADVEAAA